MATQLFLDLAILLLVAKVFGYLFLRLGLSRLVGEIAAGVLVGPVLGLVHPDLFVGELANFGILFFLFLIGLSVKVEEFKQNLYGASAVAVGAAALSIVAGYSIGIILTGDANMAAVLGIALMSTSTAVSLRMVEDAGAIASRVGKLVIGANMADEIAALLALSVVGSISLGTIDIAALATLFLTIMGFLFIILTAGTRAVGRFLEFAERLDDNEIFLTVPIAVVFIIAFISESIGIAAVTGAFLAGMTMAQSKFAEDHIKPKAKSIGHGFFIPLFFAYSALSFSLGGIVENVILVILLVVAGTLAKMVGAGVITRKIVRFSRRESMLVGLAMVPKGEYAIIIAQAVLAAGLINAGVYSAILGSVIVSILLAPLLMRVLPKK